MEDNSEVIRVRLPKEGEVIGVVEQLLGHARMRVKCLDGVTRLCRVPGKYLRRLWIRNGDVVLVQPWEIEKDKGNVIYKYSKTQVDWLARKGYLKSEDLNDI